MKKFLSILLAVIFPFTVAVPQVQTQTPPPAPERAKKEDNLVNINMNNVEIRDLVKLISDLTGKGFMIDEKVRGKVTIISPKKVTVDEAFRIFESVLEANGLTLVKAGEIYKIVQSSEAKEKRITTIIGKREVYPEDIYITQVIPLMYIDANELANVLRGLISKFANIQVYSPTNTLIITETASNLSRLMKIINELDTETYTEKIELIPLKHASADDVAKILTQVYQQRASPRGRKGGAPQPGGEVSKIIPELRTNSLIIVGAESDIASMKALIEKIDVPVPSGIGQIHVIRLSYADASNLASTLSSIAGGVGAPERKGPPSTSIQLQGEVKITADKTTNSLIIISSPSDYNTLKSVIDKLDVPRKQVFVEAVIMEVSLSKLRELGLSFHGGYQLKEGTATFMGGTTFGGISTLLLDPTALASLSGLFLGGIGETITITTETGTSITIPSFGVLLRALERETEVNVLSTPHILTMDNEEAQITVAQNVPFPTGQTVGAGGVTTQTIQRQDVGITLKITPQITAEDEVKLKIYTEVSDVAAGPEGLNINVLGLTTFRRAAETMVTVKDKQTIVIGGLMRDSVNKTELKVPLLGDIPVIGWFFRSTSKRTEKTNLLIFITPFIINTPIQLEEIKVRKIEEGREFREKYIGGTEEYERRVRELKKEIERAPEPVTEPITTPPQPTPEQTIEEKKPETPLETAPAPLTSPSPSFPEEITGGL